MNVPLLGWWFDVVRRLREGALHGSVILESIRNVDYVVLLCRDLEPMKRFYTEIMGFPIHLETPAWIEMRVGSLLLTLARRGPRVGEGGPAGSAAVQLAFQVAPAAVDSCYEELKTHGVEIVQPPQLIDEKVRHYWQQRTLFFKDPEGNLLEIYAEVDIPGE